jgi:hypothetical protein
MSNLAYEEQISEPVNEKQITSAIICAILTKSNVA